MLTLGVGFTYGLSNSIESKFIGEEVFIHELRLVV
jgi:hypothetical protein